MSDYEITIRWVEAWGDGCWSWDVHKGDELLRTGGSFFRWSGIIAAKRFACKHAKGKIKPPPGFPNTFTYTVWDK